MGLLWLLWSCWLCRVTIRGILDAIAVNVAIQIHRNLAVIHAFQKITHAISPQAAHVLSTKEGNYNGNIFSMDHLYHFINSYSRRSRPWGRGLLLRVLFGYHRIFTGICIGEKK